MGNATRTMTVVAALFWLSVAPSFGTPTAAPTPNPCSNKNCKGNAALSGFKGKALSQCTATVIAACTAATCTCGTSGTCNGATLCTPTTTTSTTSSTTTTTTLPTGPCQCGTPDPTRLQFTTAVGTGNCGVTTKSDGTTALNLACGELYVGGGSNAVPPPFVVPDMSTSLTKVTACSGTALTLGNLASTETGSNRNCTSVGCLFGPPLPMPNTFNPPYSVCVINLVASNATGTADCSSGAASISLPLASALYIDGDLFKQSGGMDHCVGGTNPGAVCTMNSQCTGGGFCSVGIQPCPICAGDGKCHGGDNDGAACTPADSALNSSFPTSQDCLPPSGNGIGSLSIALALTTGTTSLTAADYNANAQCTASGQPFDCCTGMGSGTCIGQNNVFCGFCRDVNAKGTGAMTGCFEGDPSTFSFCPHNAACTTGGPTPQPFRCCTGAGTGICDPNNAQCTAPNTPWHCCTGAGTGTCNLNAFTPCSVGGVATAACTDGDASGNAGCTGAMTPQTCCTGLGTGTCTANGLGAWPDCEQRNQGAFGLGGGGVETITETGMPSGAISDGAAHASTLVSIFCIPPSFNAGVDLGFDWPAPGAVALPGTAQLKP